MDTTPGTAAQPTASAPTPSTSPNPLESFATSLLYDKGAMSLDLDLVTGMKEDIMSRLEALSTQVVLEALTEQDAAEFERLLDNKATEAELQKFTAEKIPDLGLRMTEALTRFRRTYLGADA